MRHRWLLWALSGMVASAQASDIGQVLAHSQEMRLEGRVAAAHGSERAAAIRASFAKLAAVAPAPPQPVELQVLQGGVQAEALLGHLLVVGEAVGELPENERLMLLAHEYAHLTLDHWGALLAMYERYIPGEVKPQTTDPVAQALGRDGRALSHRQELEADAAGFQTVQRLGVGLDDALSLLMRRPLTNDTPTHPATRRRIAQLRALQMRAEADAGKPEHAPVQAAAAPGF